MLTKDISLTPKQQIAFNNLRKAIEQCKKTKILLWDNYGKISGVNGRVVKIIAPDVLDESVEIQDDLAMIAEIRSICWKGSNADDPLEVRYK